jgi:hypothetical protein
MTGDYYCSLLTKLRTKIVKIYYAKLSKGALFLQDNAPACCTARQYTCFSFKLKIVDRPVYSPDLACCLLPIFKAQESL